MIDVKKVIGIGKQSFEDIIQSNCFYIDKTSLIKEWWESEDDITLITRPRRFGKTLNMSMLYYFFSNKEKENAYLFEGLNVSKHQYLTLHQNQYPVIFLSLKDMNAILFNLRFIFLPISLQILLINIVIYKIVI